MELLTIVDSLGLRLITRKGHLSREITGVYISDLLSDVLAHAKEGNLWVTLQAHPNIVAVATMKELTGIILVNGRTPEEATIQKANEESIPIYTTDSPAFELAGQLYRLIGES
ncbi:MAG: serine kinase [Fidelibacterota bacterium]|nr:MAG: serine kinase [Candidatus Neomarinimicrobiota bacterium]